MTRTYVGAILEWTWTTYEIFTYQPLLTFHTGKRGDSFVPVFTNFEALWPRLPLLSSIADHR